MKMRNTGIPLQAAVGRIDILQNPPSTDPDTSDRRLRGDDFQL